MDKNKLSKLLGWIEKCESLSDANVILHKKESGTYGIEFEGYQTVKIVAEPIFDSGGDEELDALMNLLAHGLPILAEILNENIELEAKIEGLIDAIAIVSIVSSEKIKDVKRIVVETKDGQPFPTIGEKG